MSFDKSKILDLKIGGKNNLKYLNHFGNLKVLILKSAIIDVKEF
jgi:hypothetical protein